MTKDEAAARSAAAGAKFVRDGAAVYVPKMWLPLMEEHLRDAGMRLQLSDDGEDDGLMVLVAVLSAGVLEPQIAEVKRALVAGWALLLLLAVMIVVIPVVGASDALLGSVIACSVFMGSRLLALHRVYGRHRRMHAKLLTLGAV